MIARIAEIRLKLVGGMGGLSIAGDGDHGAVDIHSTLFIISESMPRQFLTDFELMILLAILRTGEDAYGVPIAREIEETGGRTVLLGAIYTALDRLEENGFVTSTMGDPTPERGGRAKRFFKVTGRGLKAIKATQRALTALWSGIPQLKGGTA